MMHIFVSSGCLMGIKQKQSRISSMSHATFGCFLSYYMFHVMYANFTTSSKFMRVKKHTFNTPRMPFKSDEVKEKCHQGQCRLDKLEKNKNLLHWVVKSDQCKENVEESSTSLHTKVVLVYLFTFVCISIIYQISK